MDQLPLLHDPPPFCAYAGGPCDQDFSSLSHSEGLFLFGSSPPQIASTITSTAELLTKETGHRYATWRDMDVAGQVVFCEICKTMRGTTTVYADVTTLNFNLMFEIGFAIGLGLPVRPIRDTTYSVDKRAFDSLGLLETLGYLDFTNAAGLADRVRGAGESRPVGLPPKRTYREAPIYFLKGPIDTDGVVMLLSLLKKSRIGFRMHDPVETPRLSLQSARKNISGSFGVVAHLLSPNRDGARAHNALCALLCGMAVAEQKPVAMLQEEHVQQPIDYRDLVQPYARPDQLEGLVREPFNQVIEALQERPISVGGEDLGLLGKLDLGDRAAENEIRGLREYFVPTGRFKQVERGHAQLVVGRKGSGKTAIFYGLRSAANKGRTSLVLDMRPEGHQFTRLREVVLRELTLGQQEYTISAFWTYLLSAEVGHKILNSQSEHRAAERDPQRYEAYRALEDAYLAHGLASGDDLSQRLLRQIDRIKQRFGSKTIDDRTDLTELVYGGDIRTLNDAVADYLVSEKDKVWLLIDNLDKSWATRGSTPEDMLIMRGLLDAGQRLKDQLDDRGVDFRCVVFVRSDIYDHLIQRTPDRGKDTIVSLDWDDPELFREIVHRRVAASTGLEGSFQDMWSKIAPPLMGVEDSFQYLLDRTLMRPRDLLLFLDRAIQVAVDRGHDKVRVEDIQQAEGGYSEDMFLELVFEIEDTHPLLAEALYAFQGAQFPLTLEGVRELLSAAGIASGETDASLELLVWYGFLGVQRGAADQEQYSFQVRDNVRRLLKATETGIGRFVLHPAFRPALAA